MKIKFVHYVCWCDNQIGGFPPIFTDKTHRQLEKKSMEKSADFSGQEKSADFSGQEKSAEFLVGGEIVWWDTSFSLNKKSETCFFFLHINVSDICIKFHDF